MKPVHYDHGNGISVADVDGDGLTDIYFPTQMGANQLWRNLGDGSFENFTEEAGVALEDRISVAASFADIDNDGDTDLYVTTVKMGNVLFENTGQGRFRDISRQAGVDHVGHSSGAVFFDYNRDGLLDLFLTNIGVYTTSEQGRGGYYIGRGDAFGGHHFPERAETSVLYQNMGQMRFRDVSREVGLLDDSWSGDAAFADLNGDRFPDLYVPNMQGDDHYYENRAGERFVDRTPDVFPKTSWGAMGIAFFDYNLDGLADLFITDMHSDMSEHLAPELALEKIKNMVWDDESLQGGANNIFGNSFYENRGNGRFVERSDELGVENYWPWGVSVGDLNADGFEDLFITASMNYPFRYGINSVLLNDHGRRFFDSEFLLGVEPRTGWRAEKNWFRLDCSREDADHPGCEGKTGIIMVKGAVGSRSSVLFDTDGDGDLDIVTTEFNDRPQFLVSDLSERRDVRFIKVRLIGCASNRDGLGAVVKVFANSVSYAQTHDGKSGYLSQSSLPLYFGLDEAERVDRIEIAWPSGKDQVISEHIEMNALLTVRECGDKADQRTSERTGADARAQNAERLARAVVAYEVGRFDDAIEEYDDAVRDDASLERLARLAARAHAALGLGALSRGDTQVARDSYERAVELDPYLAAAHAVLGGLYSDAAEINRAVASYESAVRLDPTQARVFNNLAWLYVTVELQPARAVELARRAVAIRPHHVHLDTLALAYRLRGNLADAEKAIRRALEAAPGNAEYRARLADILSASGENGSE
jgi:tetratricopeptide (TPR) repeat protein